MNTLIWCPDPAEVEFKLNRSRFGYPSNVRRLNAGYANTQVISVLYGYVVQFSYVPETDKVARYLYDNFAEGGGDEVINRTKKLVIDFYRELHTFGLLSKSNAFSLVKYSGATDVNLGVDFIAGLSSYITRFCPMPFEEVGIQQAAGSKSALPGGAYQTVKALRKKRRGAGVWDGPIFHLTNNSRPCIVEKRSRAWLFTRAHINDLVEEIKAHGANGTAGINVQLPLDL